jgi:hypothetical protein
MSNAVQKATLIQLGWRLGIGVALIIGGYAALLLIPLVVTADLQPQLKGRGHGTSWINAPANQARGSRTNR